jgi:hypothetical protein|tara:strand:- start:993 stop:2006 length:1014 start_codon:yes stop_codon:yes gene_type:complete
MSFKTFSSEDFVVSADAVQSTAWSTGAPTLTSFFTSSIQMAGSSGDYYVSVYQTTSTATGAAVQFDVAYGNVKGSGSGYFNNAFPQYTPSSTSYGQYRTMILEDENTNFTYGGGTNLLTPNDFWVISPDRARYKESIFPGSLNIALSGSGGLLQLTDNSNDTSVQTFLGSSRVYQLVSGSNGSSITGGGDVTNSGSYGLLFPELGTILLNPDAINATIGVIPNRGADLVDNTTNPKILINALNLGGAFTMNSQETITSDFVFCRAGNSEFNYSANPSFISGSTGEVAYPTFINNPQVYMTTIGMYNDANECIAVAKLSRPLLKDFTKEALIRVKLDF